FVKGDESKTFTNFDTEVDSYIYELTDITREIVSQEARFCYFENSGFMILYSDYKIEKISYDNSKIYIVTRRNSNEKFNFATRGCVIREGL
ncbi:MAG: hypothetical protein ACOYT4_01055, partial [Nanoarchaeota archaeon]